jgi:hypothetical protein
MIKSVTNFSWNVNNVEDKQRPISCLAILLQFVVRRRWIDQFSLIDSGRHVWMWMRSIVNNSTCAGKSVQVSFDDLSSINTVAKDGNRNGNSKQVQCDKVCKNTKRLKYNADDVNDPPDSATC